MEEKKQETEEIKEEVKQERKEIKDLSLIELKAIILDLQDDINNKTVLLKRLREELSKR